MIAMVLTAYPPTKYGGRNLLIAVGGFSVCMIAFSFSTNFYLSLGILILSGVFDGVSVVIRSTIIQLFTPDDMRGRVAAVNSIFIKSSNEIGDFESGLGSSMPWITKCRAVWRFIFALHCIYSSVVLPEDSKPNDIKKPLHQSAAVFLHLSNSITSNKHL
jgi:MFS family permease